MRDKTPADLWAKLHNTLNSIKLLFAFLYHTHVHENRNAKFTYHNFSGYFTVILIIYNEFYTAWHLPHFPITCEPSKILSTIALKARK